MSIVEYDKYHIKFLDGTVITAEDGCDFDVDIIKKIIEAGEDNPPVRKDKL